MRRVLASALIPTAVLLVCGARPLAGEIAQPPRPPSVLAPGAAQRAGAATRPRAFVAHAFRNDAAATMWVSDNQGYIWQLGKGEAVVGALTDCTGAQGIKVDRSQNLWAACTGTKTIQEYPPGASAATLVLDDTTGYYPSDVAVDRAGNVFAANVEGFSCIVSSCTTYPGNVVYWKAAQLASGAQPSGSISDPNMYEGFFLDVDTKGNVYVDMLNYGSLAGETDEIENPFGASPAIVTLPIAPHYPGGVYVSNKGTILNVVDQHTLMIDRYDLATGHGLTNLGKLPQNYENQCDPVGIGFSKHDTKVAVGDETCHALDLGVVKTNAFKQDANGSFLSPIGAAFVPSDK